MIDFRNITRSTNLYNFHTHTQYCDGRSSMQAQAEAAAEAGFTHLGFSPHSPIDIESPCNMHTEHVRLYLNEVEQLKQEFEGRMHIYAGMEIDWTDPSQGPAADYYRNLGLDYCIGSVHFIPNQEGQLIDVDGNFKSFSAKMSKYFDNDIEFVVRMYYNSSYEMLASGYFDILGHFDKIAQNASCFRPGIEDEEWYKTIVSNYIDRIIASGVTVEINTKARAEHGRFFPHERYWQRLVDAGVTLIVNSDSHYADRINASRPEALEILQQIVQKH